MIRHYQPACMPESSAPFSQVVVDDTYAHLAGIVAADFPEGRVVLGDVGDETRAVMDRVRRILAELGLALDDLVRTDVHLVNLEDFDRMDAAYREFFSDGAYPARTTTQSAQLFGGSLVEVTCLARLKS